MKEERVIIEEQMSYYKDLPQLIVALDKDDNYIHIRDTKDDCEYFCPCCRNSIKPRANKKDKEYQVQAHFYHVNGSCDEESRVHWIYKNWLFKSGSKFYVENTLSEVDHVEIEKTHKTSFGDYRPDITVHTTDGKIILFEVNFSSSKTETSYMEKWCELNCDVVEVNIKKLMNEDYNNEIPRFVLIYRDGECYKKSYASRDDYSEIAKIKNEWKRQDKINYKIMWERLDWFWLTLQNYKHQKESFENVLEAFKCINIKDKEVCFDIIKKQSCIKGKVGEFRDIINDEIIRFDIESNINKKEFAKILKISILEKKGYFATLCGNKFGEKTEVCIANKTHDLKYSNLCLFVKEVNCLMDKIEDGNKREKEILSELNKYISTGRFVFNYINYFCGSLNIHIKDTMNNKHIKIHGVSCNVGVPFEDKFNEAIKIYCKEETEEYNSEKENKIMLENVFIPNLIEELKKEGYKTYLENGKYFTDVYIYKNKTLVDIISLHKNSTNRLIRDGFESLINPIREKESKIKTQREKMRIDNIRYNDSICFLKLIENKIDRDSNSIWEFRFRECKKDIEFYIMIKQEYNIKSSRDFHTISKSIVSKDFIELKLYESMKYILEDIENYDGINSNKRYMLVEREVL